MTKLLVKDQPCNMWGILLNLTINYYNIYCFVKFDEVEALSAIYNDEWCVVDAASHVYCIQISDTTEGNPKVTIGLQVSVSQWAIPRRVNNFWLNLSGEQFLAKLLREIFFTETFLCFGNLYIRNNLLKKSWFSNC